MKCKSSFITSTKDLYTLCGTLNQNIAEKGVCISHRIAHWAWPFETPNPSVEDLSKTGPDYLLQSPGPADKNLATPFKFHTTPVEDLRNI